MSDRDFEQIVVLSSYVDGNELYKGYNLDKARELGRLYGDKHTLYILNVEEGQATVRIERRYADESLDSSEHIKLNQTEMKHFKTLLSLLD